MDDIIYFELNDWNCGRDFPNAEPFISWMSYPQVKFRDEKWVKDQKLCVVTCFVDMSESFYITASRRWVEQNCPELLTKYKEFLVFPDENNEVKGKFNIYFLPYEESNYGITWVDDPY